MRHILTPVQKVFLAESFGHAPKDFHQAEKQLAKELKKLGFIDWDLRKNLTDYKRRKLSKLIRENLDFVRKYANAPESFQKVKRPKGSPDFVPGQASAATKQHYIVPKSEAVNTAKFIGPKDDFLGLVESIGPYITRFRLPVGQFKRTIGFKNKKKKREAFFEANKRFEIVPLSDPFELIGKLSENGFDIKAVIPDNWTVTAMFAHSNSWEKSYANAAQLLNYIQEMEFGYHWNDANTSRATQQKLISGIRFVFRRTN